MPTYEFVCTECGNRIEVMQRIGDEPPTTCEVCGGILRKVFLPAGIVLKGSGFYRTDSRSAAKAASEKKKPATEKKEPAETKSAEKKKAPDKKEKSA